MAARMSASASWPKSPRRTGSRIWEGVEEQVSNGEQGPRMGEKGVREKGVRTGEQGRVKARGHPTLGWRSARPATRFRTCGARVNARGGDGGKRDERRG
jgi:hypothetical protein